MRKNKYSIVLIDDHPIIRDAIFHLLATENNLEVVGAEALDPAVPGHVELLQPDLVVVDLPRADADVARLIRDIKARSFSVKVLVYTMLDESRFAGRMADAGADGFLMKTAEPALLLVAIRRVLAEGRYFPNTFRDSRQRTNELGRGNKYFMDHLSIRERDIFLLIGDGMDTVTIASKLNISPRTVYTHRINIKNKLKVSCGKEVERMACDYVRNKQASG